MYNNYRKWRNHKRGSPNYRFDTSNSGKFTDVSFWGYLLLQSIITSVIIEVRAMIVTPINE